MNIAELSTHVFKVADVVEQPLWNQPIRFEYVADKALLTSRQARIYFLVVDGIIIKIGGSADKKGIHGTLNWYAGALSGNPDDKGRTVGIPYALRAFLDKKHKVEVYMAFCPSVECTIPSLVAGGIDTIIQMSGYKETEEIWVNQCKVVDGVFPMLNMQESRAKHPAQLLEAIGAYYKVLENGGTSAATSKNQKRPFTQVEVQTLVTLLNEAKEEYYARFNACQQRMNSI